jgi:hypothetical protein
MTARIDFIVVTTDEGPVLLAANDISYCLPGVDYSAAPSFRDGTGAKGVRVHFKAKGGTSVYLPGVTVEGLASLLNGAAY